jgi:hypothetical protein
LRLRREEGSETMSTNRKKLFYSILLFIFPFIWILMQAFWTRFSPELYIIMYFSCLLSWALTLYFFDKKIVFVYAAFYVLIAASTPPVWWEYATLYNEYGYAFRAYLLWALIHTVMIGIGYLFIKWKFKKN